MELRLVVAILFSYKIGIEVGLNVVVPAQIRGKMPQPDSPPVFSALSYQAWHDDNPATWGQWLPISFPIDADHGTEAVFVQFLGERSHYEDCCTSSKIDDGIDAAGLTAAERLAIWIYSSTDSRYYERINGELWSPPCSAEVSQFSEILNSALRKLDPHDGMAYRGYNAANFDEFLGQFDPNAILRWPGFTSSSMDEDQAFAGNVLFIIRSHNGRILVPYADKPSEQEVLFPSPTRFRVLSVEREDDAAVIELEELVT